MAEALTDPPAAPRKRMIVPLLGGIALAALLGAAGFYAGSTDMIPLGGTTEDSADLASEIAFVQIEPLIITLTPDAGARHLRLAAQLEVARPYAAEVQMLMPRILDVLNSYLRAVAPADLEAPAALVRLRAQMLRRIQIVTGEGRVRDFLVTEFVLN